MPRPPLAEHAANNGCSFPTTHWSMVRRAGKPESQEARAALARLCQEYWYPLYAFIRRWGKSPHDAQDLTQSFIIELIDGTLLEHASPDRGRFRSYVLGALQHFLANDFRRQNAERRGGGTTFVPLTIELSTDHVEERFSQETSEELSPEEAFERNWALALLETVTARLAADYEAAGKTELFQTIQPYLTGREGLPTYETVGGSIGLSANTIAMSVHRLRRRYGQILREEILATVGTDEEVDAEIAHLLAILSR